MKYVYFPGSKTRYCFCHFIPEPWVDPEKMHVELRTDGNYDVWYKDKPEKKWLMTDRCEQNAVLGGPLCLSIIGKIK